MAHSYNKRESYEATLHYFDLYVVQLRLMRGYSAAFWPMLKVVSHQIVKVFFIIHDIKSVLSVWMLIVLTFFNSEIIFIFIFKYIAQNAS